jgi:hypothetical protein
MNADDTRMRLLVRTIEAEIVPRLLMSVVTRRRSPQPLSTVAAPKPDDADELARLLIAHDGCVASAFVQIVRERGTPADLICRDLLAPTARRLEFLWEQHACDFESLTVGLGRLEALLHEVSGHSN